MNDSGGEFKVACIQFNPILNERDKNVEALLAVVEEASLNGAKLIVAPEMATTGYYYRDRASIAPFVDCIPGTTTALFEAVAKKYGNYIVFGMPEVDGETDLYYNSAVLLGPDGYIGKYRKVHLWESEAHWAVFGDLGVPVFQTELGQIAINICMDSIFFESARVPALQGADILAFPTNSSAQSISFLQERAETNGVYVLSANRSNCENAFQMIGASAVWSPLGEKLAEAPYMETSEEAGDLPFILYSQIDKTLYDNPGKRRLNERRPAVYKELMQYIAPWDFTKSLESITVDAAIIQYEEKGGSKQDNLERHEKLLAKALLEGTAGGVEIRLAVFPELSSCGKLEGKSAEEIRSIAEPIDGDFIRAYQNLAGSYGTALVIGFVEQDGQCFYNTVILINDEGTIEGLYRKVHLSSDEQNWASAGNVFPVFETKSLGRIGLLIGEDAAFPEASGVLAVKRADTIIIPSSWRGQFGNEIAINPKISASPYPKGAISTWNTIALTVQAYIIVANSVTANQPAGGRSALYTLDPLYGLDQPIVASADTEEAVIIRYETVQPDWWFNQEKMIALRQTKEYKSLVAGRRLMTVG